MPYGHKVVSKLGVHANVQMALCSMKVNFRKIHKKGGLGEGGVLILLSHNFGDF